MPRLFLIFSQSDYLILIVVINSHAEWQTVQIQISWLLRSQLIWTYTVCKGRVYPGSAGLGLMPYKTRNESHIIRFTLTAILMHYKTKTESHTKKLTLNTMSMHNKTRSEDHIIRFTLTIILTLKAPRKTASENVVCLCRLLNILADFSNLFLHTGKQCEPWSDCSYRSSLIWVHTVCKNDF